MIKRILSLVLCLSVLTGTFITAGMTVSAVDAEAMIGSTEYATFEQAVSAAGNGDVITLIKDAALESNANITKTLTVYSENGSTLTGSFNITGFLTLIGASLAGNVTIEGGSFTLREGSSVKGDVTVNGVFNFSGGSVYGAITLISSSAVLRMSGAATLSTGAYIDLADGAYFEITGDLSGTGDISVSLADAAEGVRIAALSGGVSLGGDQLGRFKAYCGENEYTVILNGNDLVIDKPAGSSEVARIGDVTYSTLAEAFEAAASTGNATVTLVSNATLSSPLSVKGNVTLDSDGNYTVYSSSTITVEKGATLTVADDNNTVTLNGSSADTGRAVIEVQGSFNMGASVTVTGNTNTSESVSKGAVCVNGGSFTMSGGAITGNISKTGTVYVASGSFTMSGGAINNNKANTAGGVYLAGGSFSLTGGCIYANSGDGVWSQGSFSLSGTGAVYSSATYPGTVFLSNGAKIKASSSWKPSAAPEGYTNIIPIAVTEPKLYDVVVEFDTEAKADNFRMSDRYENKFALTAKDKNLVIAAADEVYTVYWGNNPYMTLEEAVAALPANTSATLKIVGDTVVSASVVIKQGMNIIITTDANPASMEEYNSRTVKRSTDFTDAIFRVEKGATLTLEAAQDKALTFDGEGKSVGSAMVVTAGSLAIGNGVTLTGNSYKAPERLSGATHTFTFGGGVYVEQGGSCNISGGSISKNYASYGGGVYVNDGALNLSGGEITGNTALYGAGVYLETSGSQADAFAALGMTDGIIYSNKATAAGSVKGSGIAGGVYIGNGSVFTMSGGDIEKNTAPTASGICVGTPAYAEKIPEPQLVVSGKAKIASDNSVYLAIPNISYVLVTSNLSAQKGSIVISLPTPMAQNMRLASFYYGENQAANETAARAAATKGLFALDKAASEYFNVSVSEADRTMLVNTAGDYIPTRTKAGKHHNGLDMYMEGDTEPKEGETRTAIIYGPTVIREKGSFTTYYEMSYYPNLYKNVNTAITAPFPQGTRIVMIDTSDEENIGYYYYEVNGDETVVKKAEETNGIKTPDTIEIPLINFYKMGTKDSFYVAPVNEDTSAKAVTREKMLFVVDFTDVRAADGVTLEGEFTMVWNHYYPGNAEGERYDISGNIARSVYKVSNTTTSTLTLTAEENVFNVSYQLTSDSSALAANGGVILFQLGYGNFPAGTVLTDAEGNQYVSAGKSTVIAVPMPTDDKGGLGESGSMQLTISNYYGTALVNASVRCVIAPSADGLHYTVGSSYDAESEGVKFDLEASDEYSVLVTTPDGEKKPYYEDFDALKDSAALEMTVKGLANTLEVDSFNLTLLKKQGDEYLPCSLSELFKVNDDYGNEVILNTGNLSLELAPNISKLMGNEYKIAFKVGDAVEYVKVNVIEAK